MQEIGYEIQCSNGPHYVEGTPVGEHLAIRRDKCRGEWVIDHIPTGLRIVGVKSEEAARNVAESIRDAVDWSQVTRDEETALPKAVVNYIHKASGQHRVPPIGHPWPKPPKKSFRIDIEGSYTLTIEQLWPDGDWPEDPTEEDVLELIEREGGANCIIAEWDLDVEAEVTDLDKLRAKIDQLKG